MWVNVGINIDSPWKVLESLIEMFFNFRHATRKIVNNPMIRSKLPWLNMGLKNWMFMVRDSPITILYGLKINFVLKINNMVFMFGQISWRIHVKYMNREWNEYDTTPSCQ